MSAWGALAMFVVFVAVAWLAGLSPMTAWKMLHEGESESVVMPRSADSMGGSIVRSEESPRRRPRGSQLLAATAASLNEEPQVLHLIATSPGRTPKEGTASIGVDPAAPQTYAADAILLNGTRLSEIHHRYVVLERGGVRVRLALSARLDDVPQLALVGGKEEEVKPALAVDQLSQIVRLSPIYENDQLVGMKVFRGSDAQALSRIGLREGDIVTATNGTPIFEPGGMSELFEPLLQGQQLTVTVRRADSEQMILLDGSELTRTLGDSMSTSFAAADPPSS